MSARDLIRHTAFNERTLDRVRADAWVARGGAMVPARYGDVQQEVLAAHLSAALFDLSFVERVRIHGKGAVRMLSAAFGWDVGTIAAGASHEIAWRSQAGGVRGMGVVVRDGENNFQLVSWAADVAWFQRAAPRFDATVRNESAERGMLLLAGPYAFAVLAASGFEDAARLARGRHGTYILADVPVTIGRWDPLGGYAIVVAGGHAAKIFDRLSRAGEMFGLVLAGQEALEVLLLEAGMALPGIDFTPARDESANEPLLAALSMPPPPPPPPPKIPENGALEVLDSSPATPVPTPPPPDGTVLTGIEMESETPAPFAPILSGGAVIGHTLRSAYSPVLRRAIALAQMPAKNAAPGTAVIARTLTISGTTDITARVAALPFLPPSNP